MFRKIVSLLCILTAGCRPGASTSQIKEASCSAESAPTRSLRNRELWLNPNISSVKTGNPNFNYPVATWPGADVGNIASIVQQAGDKVPVLVAYNINNRDCGNYSGGGAPDAQAYKGWIDSVAGAIGNHEAIIILEPDALSLNTCFNDERIDVIKYAVKTLKKNPNTYVYIDAGHATFPSLDEIVDRLKKVDVQLADGISLNVSNFRSDSEIEQRATQISNAIEPVVGKKIRYVADTSRNGNGPQGDEWCNPTGRALGRKPSLNPSEPLADAYLWIKTPGESDGDCERGEPGAGQWFQRIADELGGTTPKDSPTASGGAPSQAAGCTAGSGSDGGKPASTSTQTDSTQPSSPQSSSSQPSTPSQSSGPGMPNGSKLAMLIDCFADYLPNAAHRSDNSKTDGCSPESITHCRTDKGNGDVFCKFDGTNKLKETSEQPQCYFNCQMETCNAWDEPKNPKQQQCVGSL